MPPRRGVSGAKMAVGTSAMSATSAYTSNGARTPQAAVAFRGHFHIELPANPNFPAGMGQQLGHPRGVEARCLFQGFTRKIDLPGRESLVETDLSQFYLFYAEEHRNTGRPGGKDHYNR